MCGRFTLTVSLETLLKIVAERFDIFDSEENFDLPRYNIAPSQQVLAIIHDGEKYRLGTMKWGLVPPFATDEKIGFKMINAKAETIDDKPSYKQSFMHKRCLILADGFYEWDKYSNEKTPYRIIVKDQPMIAFAGIWSRYVKPNGDKLFTCSIITTEANEMMKPIHDRMPVILDEAAQRVWLKKEVSSGELKKLLLPYDDNLMEKYVVSKEVNRPANEHPDVIKRMF